MTLDPQQLTLPDFEHETVIGTETSFAGKVDVRTGPYGYQRVAWLTIGDVSEVNHAKGANGVMRKHKVAVGEAYPVDIDVAREWIAELAEEHREKLDAFLGRSSLFDGDGVTVIGPDSDDEEPAGAEVVSGDEPDPEDTDEAAVS